MLISTKARYAIMAVVDMGTAVYDRDASSDTPPPADPISLATIAHRQNLPLAYLEQLFGKLRRAGIVTSVRGSAGGYCLARPADDICMYDIINAVDKPIRATRCTNQSQGTSQNQETTGCQHHGKRCLTHDLWDELGGMIQLFLKKVTLADVCAGRILGMGRFGFGFDHLQNKNTLQGAHVHQNREHQMGACS